jgi:hypothetical protein
MRSDYSFKAQLVYSTEVSLFLIIICDNVEAFAPFKDSFALKIWPLHSQPFTNSHIHFLITMECGDYFKK